MVRGTAMALVTALVAACAASKPVARDTDAVYRGFLRDLAAEFKRAFPGEGNYDSFVVSTGRADLGWAGSPEPKRWAAFHGQLPKLRRDTYDAFWRSQDVERVPAPGFSEVDRLRVQVVTGPELDAVFDAPTFDEGWKRYRTRFPGSTLLAFSAIGFSDDGRQALLFLDAKGWFGSYYLLEQAADGWSIVGDFDVWVS